MPNKSIPTLLLEYVDGQEALSQIRRSIKAEDRTPVRLAYIWHNGLKSKDRPLWTLVEQAAKKRYGIGKHKASGGYKWREKYRRAEKAWMRLADRAFVVQERKQEQPEKAWRGSDHIDISRKNGRDTIPHAEIPVTLLMPPEVEQWEQAFKSLKSRGVPRGYIEARIEEAYR